MGAPHCDDGHAFYMDVKFNSLVRCCTVRYLVLTALFEQRVSGPISASGVVLNVLLKIIIL
jgi:hypothetical protein